MCVTIVQSCQGLCGIFLHVRPEVPTAVAVKFTVLWDVHCHSLVDVYWHFRGGGAGVGSRFLWNTGNEWPDCMVWYLKRQQSSIQKVVFVTGFTHRCRVEGVCDIPSYRKLQYQQMENSYTLQMLYAHRARRRPKRASKEARDGEMNISAWGYDDILQDFDFIFLFDSIFRSTVTSQRTFWNYVNQKWQCHCSKKGEEFYNFLVDSICEKVDQKVRTSHSHIKNTQNFWLRNCESQWLKPVENLIIAGYMVK
jgi:hypothetical protein